MKRNNSVATRTLFLLGIALVLLSATIALADGGPKLFLFLKTGEKFATQEAAGPTVKGLTDYIGQKLAVSFEPNVMNDPVKAAEFCGTQKPAAGLSVPHNSAAFTGSFITFGSNDTASFCPM